MKTKSKRFIKLQTLLTDEQLTKIIERTKNKAKNVEIALVHRLHSGHCSSSCGKIATVAAIFELQLSSGEMAIMQEKYCKDCIEKERHLKPREDEINQSNFSEYFTPMSREQFEGLRSREQAQLKREKGASIFRHGMMSKKQMSFFKGIKT